jgi:hypothetical protein
VGRSWGSCTRSRRRRRRCRAKASLHGPPRVPRSVIWPPLQPAASPRSLIASPIASPPSVPRPVMEYVGVRAALDGPAASTAREPARQAVRRVIRWAGRTRRMALLPLSGAAAPEDGATRVSGARHGPRRRGSASETPTFVQEPFATGVAEGVHRGSPVGEASTPRVGLEPPCKSDGFSHRVRTGVRTTRARPSRSSSFS